MVRDEIRDKLAGRLRVVSDPGQADGVMRCEVTEGGGNRVAGAAARVLGVKGKMTATFRVFDRSGARVLWEETVSDKRGLALIPGDAKQRIASRVASRLKNELR
jgi:hypothetical protein